MNLEYTVTDAMTLVDQASGTTAIYLREAVMQIDKQFGEGFAQNHPEHVGAFVQAAAVDLHSAIMKVAAQDLRDAIANVAEAAQRIDDVIQ